MHELFKVEEFEHVLMFLHRLVALIKFLQTIRAPCCVPDSLQSKLHSWWRCMTSSSGPTRSCTLLRVGRTPSCARGVFRQKHQEDVELFLQSVDLTRGATVSSSAWQRRSFDRLRGGELPANPNTIVLARRVGAVPPRGPSSMGNKDLIGVADPFAQSHQWASC